MRWEGGDTIITRKKKKWYEEQVRIPSTIAGFVVLGTGITVVLKGVWMTSPLQLITWGTILAVGILLIIIGTASIAIKA